MTDGVYGLSCRLTSAPLWLGIYLFLWWFLLVLFGLFLLHWRYELLCQDKLPEFHSTPILGCIRILWLVSHPLGLGLDKALCGWNSVMEDDSDQDSDDLDDDVHVPMTTATPTVEMDGEEGENAATDAIMNTGV